MSGLFLSVINMSISAGWIVLAVLFLRFALKKAPKWLTVMLWGIVAIRLVCPFSIESVLSLIPSAETISPGIMFDNSPHINSGIPIINNTLNPIISNSFSPSPETSANPLQILIPILAIIWILGVIVLLTYTLVSFIRIKQKVSTAVLLKDNIYQSETVVSPFVFGVIKPKIYIPFGMSDENANQVIAHEQAHIKRRDHLLKPLGFLLLTLHWFNPLIWLGYILLCRDIELACDEKVIKGLNNEERANYSQALLSCSVNRRMIAACPLAFGEVGVKERVKSVLNYKKPAFWIVIVTVVALILTSICLLTNPKSYNVSDLDDELKVFLDMKVAEHHGSKDSNGIFSAVSYDLMRIEEQESKTTIYAWILFAEYRYDNGVIIEESAAHTPTVITVKKNSEEYELVEYWTPRDGTYYRDDIKNKFPKDLWSQALDSQSTIEKQSLECDKSAKKYFEHSGIGVLTDSSIKVKAIGSDLGSIGIDVISFLRNHDGQIILKVKWNNNSDKTITYGQPFKIAKFKNNQWIEFNSSNAWQLPAYPVLPLSTKDQQFRDMNREREFNISAYYNTEDVGTYRFTTDFSFEDDGTKRYKVWVDFSIITS